jgi:hypothetical protein
MMFFFFPLLFFFLCSQRPVTFGLYFSYTRLGVVLGDVTQLVAALHRPFSVSSRPTGKHFPRVGEHIHQMRLHVANAMALKARSNNDSTRNEK